MMGFQVQCIILLTAPEDTAHHELCYNQRYTTSLEWIRALVPVPYISWLSGSRLRQVEVRWIFRKVGMYVIKTSVSSILVQIANDRH